MNQQIKLILLLTIVLIIVGAGCFTKTPKTTTETATTTVEIIKKKPKIDTSANPAQNYCEKTGNELIIRFDETASSSIAYCRFADMTECEVEKYFRQTCAIFSCSGVRSVIWAFSASCFRKLKFSATKSSSNLRS